MDATKTTERGWPGHFMLSHRCSFRRNTLIEFSTQSIVISTVGGLLTENEEDFEPISLGYYYETFVMGAITKGVYVEGDMTQILWTGRWINKLEEGVDNWVNSKHDQIVEKLSRNVCGLDEKMIGQILKKK